MTVISLGGPTGKSSVIPITAPNINYEQQQQATEAAVSTSTRTQEDDKIDQLSFGLDLEYNDDEKDFLKKLSRDSRVSHQEFDDAIKTMGGHHAVQDGDQSYYLDTNAKGVTMPVPVASGTRPPKGKEIESVWGSQKSANDDAVYTTIAKNIANTLNDIVMSGEDIAHMPYGLITGKEADWYQNAKNRYDARKPKTSLASQEGILRTENIHDYSDIFKLDNWHPTADNIAGTASQVVSSVLQFLAGGAILKGAGLGAKAIAKTAQYGEELATATIAGTEAPAALSIGTKIMAKAPAFAAGYSVNLGEALDAADQAGVKGRDKYAIASLVTIPVSMIEMQLGVESKILANEAWSGEKKQMIKNLIKGAVTDSEGKITAETLEGAYKATTMQASSLIGRIAKEATKDMVSEASEEVLQNATQRASQQIYDSLYGMDKVVGEGKYGKKVISPEAIGDYINDAIGGALGGGFGSVGYHSIKRAKAEVQSESAYHAIKQGPEAINELKVNLAGAYKSGNISQDEYERAKFKIDAYQEYYDATKDANLKDEDRRKVFDMTWSNKNLESQIETINNDIKEKGDPDGIRTEQVNTKQSIISANKKYASDLMKNADAAQQSAVAPNIEPKEEKKKATVIKSTPTNKKEFKEQANTDFEEAGGVKGAVDKISEGLKKTVKKNIEEKGNAIKEEKAIVTEKLNTEESIENERKKELEKNKLLTAKKGNTVYDIKGQSYNVYSVDKNGVINIRDVLFGGNLHQDDAYKNNPKKINDKYDEKLKELRSSSNEKYIPTEQSDEIKDEPVFEQPGEHLINKMVEEKKSTIAGKMIIKKGQEIDNVGSVEVDSNSYKLASVARANQELKKQDMTMKDLADSDVEVRHIKQEDWNPEGKIINERTGEPYGDKIEVWAKNKEGKQFLVGNVGVTDYKAIKQKKAEEKAKIEEKPKSITFKSAFKEDVNITNLTDEDIQKSEHFAKFRENNKKLSDKTVLEYYKKCNG